MQGNGRIIAAGLGLALALLAAVSAAEPNDSPAEIPGPSGSADSPVSIGNAARPIFHGLIAMSFLVFAALVSDREHKHPRSRPSRRAPKL
jgi:hypothetical protein